jgi:Ca2+-binding EF-hand superfamily protein
LSAARISDFNEVFQLFDKNEDGVLSFSEIGQAMQTLGHRITGDGESFSFYSYSSFQDMNCLTW